MVVCQIIQGMQSALYGSEHKLFNISMGNRAKSCCSPEKMWCMQSPVDTVKVDLLVKDVKVYNVAK